MVYYINPIPAIIIVNLLIYLLFYQTSIYVIMEKIFLGRYDDYIDIYISHINDINDINDTKQMAQNMTESIIKVKRQLIDIQDLIHVILQKCAQIHNYTLKLHTCHNMEVVKKLDLFEKINTIYQNVILPNYRQVKSNYFRIQVQISQIHPNIQIFPKQKDNQQFQEIAYQKNLILQKMIMIYEEFKLFHTQLYEIQDIIKELQDINNNHGYVPDNNIIWTKLSNKYQLLHQSYQMIDMYMVNIIENDM